MGAGLGIDPFDEEFQVKLEAEFSGLTQRLIALGTSVILEWGFWARSERDEKRELGDRSAQRSNSVSSMRPTTNWCGGSWIVTLTGASQSPRATWNGIDVSSSRQQMTRWLCTTRLCESALPR